MRVHVLGSSAGGGFPQWNCNCRNCTAVRAGAPALRARTQSSIAVGSGADWLLVNASPDVLQQIRAFDALQPARQLRDSGIRAVLLIDAQVDHTTGLYMLRERREPLDIWCTSAVREDLTQGNPIFGVLENFCGVCWHELPTDSTEITIDGLTDLGVRAVALSSKAPPYSPHRHAPVPGDNVGITLRDRRTGRSVFYAPGLGAIEPAVWAAMEAANCVMVDGTFWTDDEMETIGIAAKRSRDLGHLSQSGPGGMIETLDRLPPGTRRMLIHINNTNPILREDGPERAELNRHGIEVCHDGLDFDI